jgi:peroxiredoxin
VQAVFDLQRELRGEQLLAAGDAVAALVEFEAVEDFPKALLADAFVAAGQPEKAVELLEKEVKERPNRLATLGRLFLATAAVDSDNQRVRELMMDVLNCGYEPKVRSPFEKRLDIGIDTRPAIAVAGDIPMVSLGPTLWSPTAAPGFDLPRADGGRLTLDTQRGRSTLVVFYLGFGCLHCVQQLEALAPKVDDFAAVGIDIIAIGNQSVAKVAASLAELGDQKFTFPMLADEELAAFRAWRCYDDFEEMPLHGTFLVDGDGKVRWQDISFEPFTQIDWLLRESQRLLALPAAAGSR